MAEGAVKTLKEVLHPWAIRIALGLFSAIGVYDTVSNRFDLPKLGHLLGMSGSLLPWWGWLLVLQFVFVIALFEYIRRNVPIRAKAVAHDGTSPSNDLSVLGFPDVEHLKSYLSQAAEQKAKEVEELSKELESRINDLQNHAMTAVTFNAYQKDWVARLEALETRVNSEVQAGFDSLSNTLVERVRRGEVVAAELQTKQAIVEGKLDGMAKRTKERDSLLWSFAAAEATIRLLDSVLIEFPKNVQLPVDKQSIDVRRASITLLADFVHTAEIKLQNTVFKDGIANLKRNAANQAEERVTASVENRELRPAGVDPIEWRGDLISEAQAVHIRKWLIAQVHDAKLSIVNLQKELYAEFVQSKS
jgi:hypothetical protein